MNYKKIILLTSLLLSIIIEVVPAAEEEVFVPPVEIGKPRKDSSFGVDDILGKGGFFFEPRAIAGSMSYSYKENYIDPNITDIAWKDYIPFLGAGITLGYKNFSLDFYARRSASGKDSSFKGIEADRFPTEKEKSATLVRKDYGINLNYKLTKKLFFDNESIIFSVGYKIGESNINNMNRDKVSDLNIKDTDFKDQYSIENNNIQFKTNGPTVGIAYAYPIGESSVLGINLAYAKLSTDYNANYNSNVSRNLDDTDGVTIGIMWSGAISNQLGYSLSLDAYSYSMSSTINRSYQDRNTLEDKISTSEFDIEETVVTAKASISYAFDLF